MGFEGRMLINPSQVAVAHEIYSPTPEDLAHAEVIKKFFEEEGLAKGLAAVSLDGKMVDTPVYQSALNTLEFYDAIQKQENRSKTK
jgi:citrate lyase subunit beta/citryl-CoA lyase